MSHLGRSELLLDGIQTPDEIIQGYDAVTREGVQSLAQELFRFDRMALSVVGRVSDRDDYQLWLERA